MLSQLMHQPEIENPEEAAKRQAAGQQRSVDLDLELVRRVSQNCPGAIERLIELHGDHLMRLIGSLSGWSPAQDDLMQETVLRAWTSASTYRGEAPLRHWLTRIAVRTCRNHQRGYRRWMTHLKSLWEQRTEQRRDAPTSESPYKDAFDRAMAKLAYADRELLLLYYIEEQSLNEIATQFGVKENTLHVRLHRSRERLKSLLQNAEELP